MKTKVLRYASLLLLVFWICVIFGFSAQPAVESENTSDSLIEKVISAICPKYDNLDSAEKQETIDRFSSPVRKAAHFTEFAVLGALSYVFLSTYDFKHRMFYVVPSMAFGFLYAVFDEIHQLFVSGRACRAFDMFIDISGVAFAVLICYFVHSRSDRVG